MNDSHCHFFSTQFFTTLAWQRGRGETAPKLCQELQWDDPGTPDALAQLCVAALDAAGVSRAALIASVPGDEASVATAVAAHPTRFVGFFMLDPSAEDAVTRAQRAVAELKLRCICLFPAMHHVALDDARVQRVVEVAGAHPGAVSTFASVNRSRSRASPAHFPPCRFSSRISGRGRFARR